LRRTGTVLEMEIQMKVAVAMLTLASLGATFAVAGPEDKNKSGQQTASTGDTTKQKSKKQKKSKKEATDKTTHTEPTK
jgi:prophage tail gpP-like protein